MMRLITAAGCRNQNDIRCSVLAVLFSLLLTSTPVEGDEKVECPVSLMIPLQDSRRDNEWFGNSRSILEEASGRDRLGNRDAGISLLATALIAMDDFNERRSDLVSGLSNDDFLSACPIQLSISSLIDSSQDATTLQQILAEDQWSAADIVSSSCAVMIGPHDEESTRAVGSNTNASNETTTARPIISYGRLMGDTVQNILTTDQHRLGGVVSPTWEDSMTALVEYLMVKERSENFAVLQSSTESSYHFATSTDENGKATTPSIFTVEAMDYTSSLTENLKEIQALSHDTIIVNFEWDGRLEELAEVAGKLGMLTSTKRDFLWIFLDRYLSPFHIKEMNVATPDGGSNLEALFHQSRIFQVIDPLVPQDERYLFRYEDRFEHLLYILSPALEELLPHWRATDPDRINDLLLPLTTEDTKDADPTMLATPSFFQEPRNFPAYGSGFVYDSVMAAGIAACTSYIQSGFNESGNNNSSGTPDFNEGELLFDATSLFGSLQLVNGTRRNAKNFQYGIFALDRNFYFENFKASLFDSTQEDGTWTINREQDDRFLLTGHRVAGFVLSAIAILASLISAIFVYVYRTNRVVSIAQPEFLYLICIGASMFGLSIVFQSFDDSHVEKIETLDGLCLAQAWMRYCGQLTVYMALFCKLWRIDKLSQLRRNQRLFARHVIWPFILLLVACFGVLVAYTIHSPPTFERYFIGLDDALDDDELDDDFFYDPVTVPLCTPGVYIIPLQLMIMLSLALVTFMSCKTRRIAEDMSDARRILQVLIAQVVIGFGTWVAYFIFQVLGAFNAAHSTRVASNFLYSITTTGILIGSKMRIIWKQRSSEDLPEELQTGRVTVTGLEEPTTQMPISKSTRTDYSSANPGSSQHLVQDDGTTAAPSATGPTSSDGSG